MPVSHLVGMATLVGDCANVVRDARQPPQKSMHHSRMHAAANRLAGTTPSAKWVQDDLWVKAHRKPELETNPMDAFTAVCNNLADAAAVGAQGRLDPNGPDRWADIDRDRNKLTKVCRMLAVLAEKWPAAKAGSGGAARTHAALPKRTKPRKAQMVPDHAHHWAQWHGKWACRQCLTPAKNDEVKVRKSRDCCPGYTKGLATILTNTNGHKLACLEVDEKPVILCTVCGSFASRCPEKLKAPCQKPSKSGTAALIRVAKGRHPDNANGGKISTMVPFDFDPDLEQRLSDLAATRRTKHVSAPPLSSRISAGAGVGNSSASGSSRLTEMAARIRAKEAEARTAAS